MLEENQLIEMMDGTNYVILDKIEYENEKHLYIAEVDYDTKPTGEFNIVKEKIIENVPTLDYVEDEELYEILKLSFEQRSEINSIN